MLEVAFRQNASGVQWDDMMEEGGGGVSGNQSVVVVVFVVVVMVDVRGVEGCGFFQWVFGGLLMVL